MLRKALVGFLFLGAMTIIACGGGGGGGSGSDPDPVVPDWPVSLTDLAGTWDYDCEWFSGVTTFDENGYLTNITNSQCADQQTCHPWSAIWPTGLYIRVINYCWCTDTTPEMQFALEFANEYRTVMTGIGDMHWTPVTDHDNYSRGMCTFTKR